MRGALERMLTDMFRDMQDVGFYVGEYAAKKFEISRSLLPELFAGVQRLEEEERERRREHASTLLAEDSADVPEEPDRASTAQEQRQRCLSILRRLAFGMNRCICKSNGEMAYQLLYQQEQYGSFAGYNMIFRLVPYACREVASKAASLRAPHMQVDPLDAPEEPDSGPMPVRELAELSESDEEGGQSKASARLRVAQFNQKDDYLHRGRNPLLRCMSMVLQPSKRSLFHTFAKTALFVAASWQKPRLCDFGRAWPCWCVWAIAGSFFEAMACVLDQTRWQLEK